MNYLDGLLAIMVFFTMQIGYRRGLISLIAGLAGRLIILLSTLLIVGPVTNWVGTQFGILDKLGDKLISFFPRAKAMAEGDMGRITAQKLPQALDKMGLPPLLKYKVMEQAPELMAGGSASVTAITQEMASLTAFWLLQFCLFVLLFLLGSLLLRWIIILLDGILAGTIFGFLNRCSGMFLSVGLLIGFLTLLIGFTAPLILAPPSGGGGFFSTWVQGSYFYPWFLEAYGLLLGAIISYQ